LVTATTAPANGVAAGAITQGVAKSLSQLTSTVANAIKLTELRSDSALLNRGRPARSCNYGFGSSQTLEKLGGFAGESSAFLTGPMVV
jgi:hypothetical protein